MKRAIRAVMQAFYEAFIRPVWATNAWLGPFAGLLTVAAGVVVGFVSKRPLWGAIVILAGALLLAFVALVERVVRDSTPVVVPDDHRNYIKAIAQSYRGTVLAGTAIRENDDDWLVLEGHFPAVAAQLRRYNERLVTVDTRKRELRNRIGGMTDGSRVEQRFQTSAYDCIVKVTERLVDIPGGGLSAPVTYRWSGVGDVAVVESSATGGNTWAIADSDDRNLPAIRAEVEQMAHDAQKSEEANAVITAIAELHNTQNEVAKSLDRIGRLVTITGTCPDCDPQGLAANINIDG